MKGIIFTPDDEPYLGREALRAFDEVIIAAMEINQKAAKLSYKNRKTDIQEAATIIIPQGFSISLSTRELLRQGYLFGAKVLQRSLLERAITIQYLDSNKDALKLWNDGWPHRKRPSLAKMIESISLDQFKGSDITNILNSVVHGDPLSSSFNLNEHSNLASGFSSSKILNNPKMCDEISLEASAMTCVLMAFSCKIFNIDGDNPA